MGAKLSINVETPAFNAQEWEYLPEEEDTPEDQGIYRTLRHRKTGEKIDQYEFMWANEEEFLYYLKSYNWRSRQENIVNSKFLLQKNKEEICSYSYMACIYVEHMKLRLSEINDIPYPDNLYMLMEALEGYSKIYEHSKYFIVEENQICVDDFGNVKVWVNGDLSINYPSIIVEDNQRMGQEEMVDAIINMIADNTDYETEPKPSFREYYYQKKKGTKGKKFDEARNLVFSYARLNNIEIPSRFEAIFNITNDDIDVKTFTQQSVDKGNQSNQGSRMFVPPPPSHAYLPCEEKHFYTQSLGLKEPTMGNTIYNSTNPTSHVIPIPPYFHPPMQYSFGSKSQQQLLPFSENGLGAQIQSEIYRFGGSQINSGMPHYQSIYKNHLNSKVLGNPMVNTIQSYDSNMQVNANPNVYQPARSPNTLAEMGKAQVSYFIPNPAKTSTASPPKQSHNHLFTNVPHTEANSYFIQPKQQRKYETEQENVIEEENGNIEGEGYQYNLPSDTNEERRDDDFVLVEDSNINLLTSNIRNKPSNNPSGEREVETDDQVAKSLPIKTDYPSFNKRHLSSMANPNKAVLSHIEPAQKWPSIHSFGENQAKAKGKGKSLAQVSALNEGKKKLSAKPMKYFYLNEEFEIDPTIAADLANLA